MTVIVLFIVNKWLSAFPDIIVTLETVLNYLLTNNASLQCKLLIESSVLTWVTTFLKTINKPLTYFIYLL